MPTTTCYSELEPKAIGKVELFFFSGVYETANQGVLTSKYILALFQNDQQKIEALGRSLSTTLQVYKLLKSMPIINIQHASKQLHITTPTATAALTRLQDLGIVSEITNKRRAKLYSYNDYIRLLAVGTEPIK